MMHNIYHRLFISYAARRKAHYLYTTYICIFIIHTTKISYRIVFYLLLLLYYYYIIDILEFAFCFVVVVVIVAVVNQIIISETLST